MDDMQIKCTTPTSYSVKPPVGFVEPGETVHVSVYLLKGDRKARLAKVGCRFWGVLKKT